MPFLLLIIGFVFAALVAVLDVTQVNWLLFAAPLAVGFFGVIWHRRRLHAEASHGEVVQGNLSTLQTALGNIVNNLGPMVDKREELPTHQARFDIDRLFREDLNDFANAREAMSHAFGLQAYADVMSAFAAGERYINRVWSASADGYVDEVNTYLQKALNQFKEAHQLFTEQQAKRAAARGEPATA